MIKIILLTISVVFIIEGLILFLSNKNFLNHLSKLLKNKKLVKQVALIEILTGLILFSIALFIFIL